METYTKIIVDVGSSTVKVYGIMDGAITPIIQKSIHFKEDFNATEGISAETKKELFELLESVQDKYKNIAIKLYATGIFRSFSYDARTKFVDEVYSRMGFFFNIVPHELENFYLEMALTGKCLLDEPVLLINIGGGSTELVVMCGKECIERHNISIGVGIINQKFSGINEEHSIVQIENVVAWVKETLPTLSNLPRIAIYNGGELTYMRLAGYRRESNSFFVDIEHPDMIHIEAMKIGNEKVFSNTTLKELESLMPHDPRWMHGARGCSAIAQAICETYGVTQIIPSDSNMVNGIMQQEFRHVTLSGSFRKHLDYILDIKKMLEQNNIRVLSPRFTEPKNPGDVFVVFAGEDGMTPLELEHHHLDSIKESDALVVCNPNGYVGASALIEIGYAQAFGKKIVFTEKPEEFMLNTLPSEIGL